FVDGELPLGAVGKEVEGVVAFRQDHALEGQVLSAVPTSQNPTQASRPATFPNRQTTPPKRLGFRLKEEKDAVGREASLGQHLDREEIRPPQAPPYARR